MALMRPFDGGLILDQLGPLVGVLAACALFASSCHGIPELPGDVAVPVQVVRRCAIGVPVDVEEDVSACAERLSHHVLVSTRWSPASVLRHRSIPPTITRSGLVGPRSVPADHLLFAFESCLTAAKIRMCGRSAA
jgi:hypothetical protein